LNKDYEETTPLARAEWIIFNASLFDQEEEAQKYFSVIEDNYQKLKIQNQKEVLKPSVLVGSIQNGFWFTCGGTSDLAQMIEDAGAALAFKNNRASSQQVSLEEFALKKTYYDYWLPHNEWKSSFELAEAKKSDSRYQFIQTRKIFNNTLVLNKDNFNDYWEEGMQRPDLVLLDLSAIFHPNSFKNHKMRWYKPL
jgi:iron complex transport system substrate-binding protein